MCNLGKENETALFSSFHLSAENQKLHFRSVSGKHRCKMSLQRLLNDVSQLNVHFAFEHRAFYLFHFMKNLFDSLQHAYNPDPELIVPRGV